MRFKMIIYLIAMLIYGILSCDNIESGMVKRGNEIVKKIENYRDVYGDLPDSLREVGVKEGPVYYWKVDSVNYILWFGTYLGESVIYYSDSKRWEKELRGFKR